MGYDIRRTGDHPYKRPIDFIFSRNIDLVIDAGANVGQYGAELRKHGYKGWIISFEPVLSTYEELEERAKADGRWRTFNLALGSRPGSSEINVSESSDFSSILDQSEAATAFDPQARVVRKESIQIVTLDEMMSEIPPHRAAYLKIDTQGYEKEILSGASKSLPRLLGVQMEIPIMHLYQGTWRFAEAVYYMNCRGFEISNIIPVNYDHTDPASLLEIDCIFRRA